ncbi:MAG TPA: aromatic aminobenezylarsenical efflux permease ArsG family transporter, partial [Cyclobacteriaceae bacterium]|nr:aromatic aminobenezylarsenical efflux permease ArsG family transporter [Cyclobacteriaceae bacterium]
MEKILNGILENSSFPVVSAFVLGLMTAISPCPLATNITAIGFIGKEIENNKRVFINGLVYTAGRAITYTLLAFIIYIGADQFKLSGLFQKYGEKILGPLLIVIGFFLLGILTIKFPGLDQLTNRYPEKGIRNYRDVLLLGIIFALAFCPFSGVLYFGMLIPLTISASSGLLLPVVFALATGIPVIIFAWILAYAVSRIGKIYNGVKTFEL